MKAQLPLAGTVVASDAFFPFRDGVDEIAKAGATAVIQPGGSVKDEEVIAAADEHGWRWSSPACGTSGTDGARARRARSGRAEHGRRVLEREPGRRAQQPALEPDVPLVAQDEIAQHGRGWRGCARRSASMRRVKPGA